MTTTSDGLIALLKRKGIDPTGDREKDLELAKSVMPEPYKKGGCNANVIPSTIKAE